MLPGWFAAEAFTEPDSPRGATANWYGAETYSVPPSPTATEEPAMRLLPTTWTVSDEMMLEMLEDRGHEDPAATLAALKDGSITVIPAP